MRGLLLLPRLLERELRDRESIDLEGGYERGVLARHHCAQEGVSDSVVAFVHVCLPASCSREVRVCSDACVFGLGFVRAPFHFLASKPSFLNL